jgi:integrase
VPILASLAAKLRQATSGKSSGAPLLTKADNTRWQAADHVRPFARAAAQAGLAHVTAYALRHSSIIRALLAGVPTRVAAALHDTSAAIIETNYARFILDHSDSVSRRALLDLSAAAAVE